MTDFDQRNKSYIAKMSADSELKEITKEWFIQSSKYEYSYHFSWLGRPIIQFPQDIIALQEIIWKTKPDLIIETGIAHGGSLIFSASMLELIGSEGRVLGIDIEIREHNRKEIERHPLFKRIDLLEGSSIDPVIVEQVYNFAKDKKRILVILDSMHTHQHVLKELEIYSPLVKPGDYLIVFDTVINEMPDNFFPDRPWSKTNNPMTAVKEFLQKSDRFEVDFEIQQKLLITVAPNGYLKCLKN